jgi:molybdopterin-containing oxidoreductase family membrane subunit
MSAKVDQLPYGVGRFSPRVWVGFGALAVLVGWGLYAYARQLAEGLVVTGLRDIGSMAGAAWGLYIAFDIYFVGVSFAGISTAALIRLLRLEHLKPVSRMAELLTVISLILAAFSVLPDLGLPLRGIVNLFRYARPQSPFFGTFTLVISGYLFASLVYLYLDGRRDAAVLARVPGPFQGFYRLWAAGYGDTPGERARHHRASLWLAIAILPLLVTAHSTLGFVFGIQAGRPGWFSALQAPGFVVMAGVSGIGLLLVIAAVLRKSLREEERLHEGVFRSLDGMLLVLVLAYLYFMVAELLTMIYAAPEAEARVTWALLAGAYAALYWTGVGALVLAAVVLAAAWLRDLFGLPLPAFRPVLAWALGVLAAALWVLWMALARPGVGAASAVVAVAFVLSLVPLCGRSWVAAGVVSGLLVNVAAVAKRLLIVVPSQTHGTLLPYPVGSYTPTWVEYSILVGLLALGTLLYAAFVKVFPIMEVEAGEVA